MEMVWCGVEDLMMIGLDQQFALGVPVGGVCEDFINQVVEVPRFQNVVNKLGVGVGNDDDCGSQLLHGSPYQLRHVWCELQPRHQGEDFILTK